MRRLLFVCLLVLLSGCGASSQQEIAAVIRSSDEAWQRGDLSRACSYMTARARREYVVGDAEMCSEAVITAARLNAEDHLVEQHLYVSDAEPRPHVTSIRVDGDTAVVRYSSGDPTVLRRTRDRWLIDSF